MRIRIRNTTSKHYICDYSCVGYTREGVRQCCESEMIYSGSGSNYEFSEFRIRIQVPDPCGSGSTTLVSGVSNFSYKIYAHN